MTRNAQEQFMIDLIGDPALCARIEAAGVSLDSPGLLDAWREGAVISIQERRREARAQSIVEAMERNGNPAPSLAHDASSMEAVLDRLEHERQAASAYVPAQGAPSIDAVADAMARLTGRAA